MGQIMCRNRSCALRVSCVTIVGVRCASLRKPRPGGVMLVFVLFFSVCMLGRVFVPVSFCFGACIAASFQCTLSIHACAFVQRSVPLHSPPVHTSFTVVLSASSPEEGQDSQQRRHRAFLLMISNKGEHQNTRTRSRLHAVWHLSRQRHAVRPHC